jgi:DNA-binding XRE family transcriptional regulator
MHSDPMPELFKTYNPSVFKMKRIVLGVTATELSSQARISRLTLLNLERGASVSKSIVLLVGITLDRILEYKLSIMSNPQEAARLKKCFELLDSN